MSRFVCCLRRLMPLLVWLPLCCQTGCRRAEIEAYAVPRPNYRLLGAIVPSASQDYWMVKLAGETQAVAAEKANFMAFVNSMTFPPDDSMPVTWSVPPGWTQEAGRGLRFASLYVAEPGLVVTVFRFGPETARMVPQNVNRWRAQLNLPPISVDDFVRLPRQKIGDTEGWIIDLESKTLAEQPQAEVEEPVTPETPPGWEALPRAGAPRLAGYKIGKGTDSAEMTVTQFPGDVGGLAANVNRWRDQVGLGPIDAAKIQTETTTIEVRGKPYVYVDAAGPMERVLGVIYPIGENTIFFKLKGPKATVGKEKTAFENFVRSFPMGGL